MRWSPALITATASLALLSLSNHIHAYGILGHTLTGQVAQVYLTPETARQVKDILNPSYEGLLSKAAPWPDTVKGDARYKWASELHYVNTPGDNPPEVCLQKYTFTGKDVVNGLFNMTAQLKQFKDTPPTTAAQKSVREDALRFFVHFMGDVHQPLHASGKDRGGNDAPAKWVKTKSNLHSIWDTKLIQKDVADRFKNDPKAYLDNILQLTRTLWKPSTWIQCEEAPSSQEPNPWSNTTLALTRLCPIEWSKAMNALDCSVVWKDYDPAKDYSLGYFQGATGKEGDFLVQRLIAMAGVRMAAVLNEIYDPSAKHSLVRRRRPLRR